MRTLEGAGQRGTPSTIARSVARRQGGDERESERASQWERRRARRGFSRCEVTCALPPSSDGIHELSEKVHINFGENSVFLS